MTTHEMDINTDWGRTPSFAALFPKKRLNVRFHRFRCQSIVDSSVANPPTKSETAERFQNPD